MYKFFCLAIISVALLESCTYENVEPAKTEVKDTVITYSKTILPLITTQCGGNNASGCHEVGSQDGDFSTYDGLKEKADDGSLVKKVIVLKDMPKAGSGFTLTDQERSYFEAWVKQGALNN